VKSPKWRDSGEGGLAAYAVFVKDPKGLVCIPGVGAKLYSDVILSSSIHKLKVKTETYALNRILQKAKHYAVDGVPNIGIKPMSKKTKRIFGVGTGFSVSYGGEENHKISEDAARSILYENGSYARCLDVSAIVYLGSTGASLSNYDLVKNGRYFTVERKHLTPKGKRLLATLEKLYDHKAEILTVLDT